MDAPGPGVTCAQLVRACREARGLSKRALSLQAGVSESVVGKLEAGTPPSLRVFAAIVTTLGMSNAEIALLVTISAPA